MYGKVKADTREILRTLCRYKKVEIIEGAICADHVHLCLSIPPKLAISEFMGYLKGKSALMIFDKHPELGTNSSGISGHVGITCPRLETWMKQRSESISRSRKKNPTKNHGR